MSAFSLEDEHSDDWPFNCISPPMIKTMLTTIRVIAISWRRLSLFLHERRMGSPRLSLNWFGREALQFPHALQNPIRRRHWGVRLVRGKHMLRHYHCSRLPLLISFWSTFLALQTSVGSHLGPRRCWNQRGGPRLSSLESPDGSTCVLSSNWRIFCTVCQAN